MSADDIAVSQQWTPGYRTAHAGEGLSRPVAPAVSARIMSRAEGIHEFVRRAGLAFKTQMVFCGDHAGVTTRASHSRAVAELSGLLAIQLGGSMPVAYLCGLAHDCGHGPGGHSFERFFSKLLVGCDHGAWGFKLAAGANIPSIVAEAMQRHSWENPASEQVEVAVVSLADRVEFLTQDWRDAADLGLVANDMCPWSRNTEPAVWQREFVNKVVVDATSSFLDTGGVCLSESTARELDALYLHTMEYLWQSRPLQQIESLVFECLKAIADPMLARGHSIELVLEYIWKMSDTQLLRKAFTGGGITAEWNALLRERVWLLRALG